MKNRKKIVWENQGTISRKVRDDKLTAYSTKGEEPARRKAKALGSEECFVAFLSAEEAKKRREGSLARII